MQDPIPPGWAIAMSYDRRRSTPVINGTRPPSNSGSIPPGRLSEFAASAPRPMAPAVDPQQMLKELQRTRQQLQQVTQEKQRLEALAQQLHQEIVAALDTVEGVQSALTRTQRQLQQLSRLASSEGASVSPRATPASAYPDLTALATPAGKGHSNDRDHSPHPPQGQTGQSSPDPSYGFLNRLKRRQGEEDRVNPDRIRASGPSTTVSPARPPDRSTPPPDASAWQAVPPPFPAPPPRPMAAASPRPYAEGAHRGVATEESRYGGRSHRSRKGSASSRPRTSPTYPPYGSSYPPGDTPSGYGTLTDADLLEHLGLEPQDPDYVSSLQKHRQRQSPSMLIWIAVALLLVVGSFGAGFLVVQPFIQDAEPPVEPFPIDTP